MVRLSGYTLQKWGCGSLYSVMTAAQQKTLQSEERKLTDRRTDRHCPLQAGSTHMSYLSVNSFNILVSKIWMASASPKAHRQEERGLSGEDPRACSEHDPPGPSWRMCIHGQGEVALFFWEATHGKPQEAQQSSGVGCTRIQDSRCQPGL